MNSEWLDCAKVSDASRCNRIGRFDDRARYLFEVLSFFGRELFRKDGAEWRRPGMRRKVQKDVPRPEDRGEHFNMQLQVDLGETAGTDEIEQIPFRIVSDRALGDFFWSIRILCRFPAMQDRKSTRLNSSHANIS